MMFLRDKVLIYCALQLIAGLAFWAWALVNIFKCKILCDYGIFTFPFLFFAGLNGITSVRNPHVTIASKHAKAHFLLTIVAHSVVTINYIIGGIVGGRDGKYDDVYKIYCYICAFAVAVSGVIFSILAYNWQSSFEKMTHAMTSLNMY